MERQRGTIVWTSDAAVYEYSTTISFILISKDRQFVLDFSAFPRTPRQEDETEVPRIEGRDLHKQRVVAQRTFEIN